MQINFLFWSWQRKPRKLTWHQRDSRGAVDSSSCPAGPHHHGPSPEGNGLCPCPGAAELEICCGTGSLPRGEAKTTHTHGVGKTQPHSAVLFPSYFPGSRSESRAVPAAMLIKADVPSWAHRRFLEPVCSSSDMGTSTCIGSLRLPRELNKLSSLKTRSLRQPETGSLNENAVYFLVFVFYTPRFMSGKQFIVQTAFELLQLISDSVNRVVDYKIRVLFIRLFQWQTLIQSRTGLRSHSKALIAKLSYP